MGKAKPWFSTRWNPMIGGKHNNIPSMGEDKSTGEYVRFDEANREIDRLRETNRRLHRRAQAGEGIKECAIGYIELWLRVLNRQPTRNEKRDYYLVRHILHHIRSKTENRLARDTPKPEPTEAPTPSQRAGVTE